MALVASSISQLFILKMVKISNMLIIKEGRLFYYSFWNINVQIYAKN